MLPYQITVTGKGTIKYIYDAAGNKLEKRTFETALDTTTTTSYIGGFVYQQINTATPTLQFFGHEEGRFRPSTYATAFGGFAADYFIKDHLGNTRTVLTDEQITNTYPAATLEDGAVTTEQGYYNINISPSTIIDKSTLPDFRNPPDNTFNYTNNNKIPMLKAI